MITRVSELPPRKNGIPGSGSYVEKDVRQFLRLGAEYAEVSYEGKNAKSVMTALRNYLKRHPEMPVTAEQRQNRVFLIRRVDR